MDSIFKRVSVRNFEPRQVEPEKIEKILRAGMAAPSAGNQQPWEFYVVTNPQVIQELAKASQYSGCAAKAPVVIVPVCKKECWMPEYADIDLSYACENMWLEADALGLGTVVLAITPFDDRKENVKKALNLPDDVYAYGLMPVGYPAAVRPQQDRFDPARVHYVI